MRYSLFKENGKLLDMCWYIFPLIGNLMLTAVLMPKFHGGFHVGFWQVFGFRFFCFLVFWFLVFGLPKVLQYLYMNARK